MNQPADRSDTTRSHEVAVTVVRSGGFAGLTRTWEATADDPSAASVWLGLADSLPWGQNQASRQDPRSVDRFVYRIRIVVRSEVRREATLPESALTGGWRDLVERVQRGAAADADPDPSASATA